MYKCPIFLQNAMISAYGYYWKHRRMGGEFKKQLEYFKQRETYSKEEWSHFQTQELRGLLKHTMQNVSFYQEKYKEVGLEMADIATFELSDLDKLPYLEKEDLRKFGKSTLLASNRSKGNFYSSSGSTGTPISVYFSKSFHQVWNAAYEARVRQWAGVHHSMRRGMIGGRRILPTAEVKPPFYRYNLAERQTYFSAYHLAIGTVENYNRGLVKNKVEYLVGYAMSIYLWADLCLKSGLKPPSMKAVLTSSEKLTPEMRSTIEAVFQCKAYDAYSGVEACGLISENRDGALLFSPDTGIMEVLDAFGVPVENGEAGELIATGLLNFDQPLIRYRIGDRVKKAKIQDYSMLKIDEIEGRIEDVIIGADGQKMVRFHGVFINIKGLKLAQVVQLSLVEIQINLVVEPSFDRTVEVLIEDRIKSQLGAIEVQFNYRDHIPLAKNAKFKAVVSKLK